MDERRSGKDRRVSDMRSKTNRRVKKDENRPKEKERRSGKDRRVADRRSGKDRRES